MEYKGILCWTNIGTQKEILKYNKSYNYPIYFANGYEDFIGHISSDSLLVISRKKIGHYIRKLTRLVRQYPSLMFYTYVSIADGSFCVTDRESIFSYENNVNNCDHSNIFNIYKSDIPTEIPLKPLWEFRKKYNIKV
jgi:hypothetical protein